jgi:hypothetical protein
MNRWVLARQTAAAGRHLPPRAPRCLVDEQRGSIGTLAEIPVTERMRCMFATATGEVLLPAIAGSSCTSTYTSV